MQANKCMTILEGQGDTVEYLASFKMTSSMKIAHINSALYGFPFQNCPQNGFNLNVGVELQRSRKQHIPSLEANLFILHTICDSTWYHSEWKNIKQLMQ